MTTGLTPMTEPPTDEQDNASLAPRRLNRNMRLREAQVEYNVVMARAGSKLGEALRAQYFEGVPVAWRTKTVAVHRIRWGIALKSDDLAGPFVRAKENRTGEVFVLTVEDILRAGDDD